MSAKKTVAIIGAGNCGLGALKSCLEDGLEPTVFDKLDRIGGIWNYNPDTSEGTAARVFKNLVINSCTIMTCYSDFPFPKEAPPFVHHTGFLKYFNDYADHFKLRDHIQLNTEVVKVEPADDYDETGKWTVSTRQHGQTVVKKTFDNVMICTGAFTEPFIPPVPGMSQFQGEITHTYRYRESTPFAGKKVVVVGESFSACDIAAETGNVASQVYLSIHRGFWVYPRRGPGGWPYDTFHERRIAMTWIPMWLMSYLYKRYLERDIDYDVVGIKPDRKVFEEAFVVNDVLLSQINCGKVKIVPAIKEFLPKGVEFTDGTKLDGIDVVIYGTGYNMKTPFIDDSLLSDDINTRELYKYVFPIRLSHPTLACIGFFPPETGLTPTAEAQSRWAVRVFQGKTKLPSVEKMKRDIDQKADELCKRYGRPKFFVNGIVLADELAKEIGCYPSLKRLFMRDPRLAVQVFLSPVTPFTYRLLGPHPWPGARDAVMNCWDACVSGIEGPTSYKGRAKVKQGSWIVTILAIMTLLVVIVSLIFNKIY